MRRLQREVSNRIGFGEKRLSGEDVGFRMLKKRATSIIINQPAPELSKRRQIKLYLAGASPLMHKRRINSYDCALFVEFTQIIFTEKNFFISGATNFVVVNSNRMKQLFNAR